MKYLTFAVAILLIPSCATLLLPEVAYLGMQIDKNYEVDGVYTRSVGQNVAEFSEYELEAVTTKRNLGHSTSPQVREFAPDKNTSLLYTSSGVIATTVDSVRTPKFSATLMFMGMENSNVKLSYREFSGEGTLRTSFEQAIQYNLDESSKIVWRDFVIEVLDASPSDITYKVVSDYPNSIRPTGLQ